MLRNRYMARAIALSLENAHSAEGGPFGCVIVKGDKVVGEGKNSVTKNYDPSAHAECMAIRDACAHLRRLDLPDCELYTNSQPCPMCTEIIRAAGISRVYYANTVQDAAEIGFADVDLDSRSVISERIEDPEAITAFEIWFANPKRKMYFTSG